MSKSSENPIVYIESLSESQSRIGVVKALALVQSGDLYGVEIRYPSVAYEITDEDFRDMCDALPRRSGGTVYLTSSEYDARNGILSLKVACANHAYDDRKCLAAIKMLLEEILPSLKR